MLMFSQRGRVSLVNSTDRLRRYFMDYRFSLVGLLIGFLVGLTGMGGGSLLPPIMILVFGILPVWAVGTEFPYSTVTKAAGSIVHIRQKNVNFKIARGLASAR